MASLCSFLALVGAKATLNISCLSINKASEKPARPPGDQTCLSEGGELGACQQNRPISELLVARLHRGKSEVVDQQAEKRLEVDWKNTIKVGRGSPQTTVKTKQTH